MNAIIAYYSNTGNTEKAARAIGNALLSIGVEVHYEKINPLKIKNSIKNLFMSLFRMEVPILNTNLDMSLYDYVIIGGPVWFMNAAPPLNSFLKDITGIKGKKAAAFVTAGSIGGQRVLSQISHSIKGMGGNFTEGIKFDKRDMEDKSFDAKVRDFVKTIKKS